MGNETWEMKGLKSTILKTALEYAEKYGYSVIPVKRDNKKPYIPWIEFQERQPTADEIREWWQKWPSANIGIITGQISGICVVDIDEPKGFEEIKKFIPDGLSIPTCKTPGGGQHLYFEIPEESLSNNS
jgi:hypothetical protein